MIAREMVPEPAAPAPPEARAASGAGEPPAERPRIELQVAGAVLAALPALLVLYFSFNGGGYFAGTVGFAAVIVIQLLIVRVLLAERPFAGVTRQLALVGLAGAAFVAWVLLSGLWAHARDRTLIEFDRDLFYVLVFLLFGMVPRTAERMRWIVRLLTAAIVFVATCALITRLLPHTWPTHVSVVSDRLSFPLTYWNSLALLCGVGILLCLGLVSSPTERRPVQAAACGALPILATTLYFTFSRGSILATVVGLVVYLGVARSGRVLWAVIASAPPTAIALLVAYHADKLSSSDPTSAAALTQGKHMVPVVILCALGAAVIRLAIAPLDRVRFRERDPRLRPRIVLPSIAGLVLVVAIAAGAPGWISHQYHAFVHAAPKNVSRDLRNRLTDPSSNGRIDHWRAAIQAYRTSRLHGVGAGTYQFEWEKRRKIQTIVVDGHSLYIEVLGELGIVGLLLLLAFLVGIAYGIARRIQGPNQLIYAGVFAAFIAWAVEAGVDWQWEMPAVTAWVFAVGGTALAARRRAAVAGVGDRFRVPVAVALGVAAVTPVLLLFSQSRLQDSAHAFERGDCTVAVREARSSINVLAVRPEPYQILGYCDLQEGRPTEAIAAFRKAIEQEPRSWEYRYGLALSEAAAGHDPNPALRAAVARDPVETLVQSAVKALKHGGPDQWAKASATLRQDVVDSGRLSLR